MSTIAATPEWVYTLESGTIYRHKADAPEQRGPIDTPDDAAQIMTTDSDLYVLDDNGAVFRRKHNAVTWYPLTVPTGTTQISSSPTTVFAIATGGVYKRHDASNEVFSIAPNLALTDVYQLDHDEGYSYALTDNGTIYFADDDDGVWTQYPIPISNVVEIAAGVDFIYARTDAGAVYRSKHIGFTGWTQMGNYADVLGITIDTKHRDKLWFRRASGIESQSATNWIGRVTNTAPANAWITAAWIDGDWITVA